MDISPVAEDYQQFQRPVLGPMSPGAPLTPTRRPQAPNQETPNVPQSPKQKRHPHAQTQGQSEGQGQPHAQPVVKEMVNFPIDHAQAETNGVVNMGASATGIHQGAVSHHPRMENRPIIIIKEGSVANSEELEKVSMESDHGEAIVTAPTQRLIQPDPPSHASRSSRSLLDSPQNSLRVELSSPRRVSKRR